MKSIAHPLFTAVFAASALVIVAAAPAEAMFETENRYLCYKGKDLQAPPFGGLSMVPLMDEFIAVDADLRKLVRVCVPVDQDGSGTPIPELNYCEYKVKPDGRQLKGQVPKGLATFVSPDAAGLAAGHSFGVRKPDTLMVPCTSALLCENPLRGEVCAGTFQDSRCENRRQLCLVCMNEKLDEGETDVSSCTETGITQDGECGRRFTCTANLADRSCPCTFD